MPILFALIARPSRRIWIALAVSGVLAAGSVRASAQARAGAVLAATDLRQASQELQSLARRVGPSVVEIITLGYATGDLDDNERGLLVAPSRGSGSGVIVSADGYIVTNAHVVQGAHRIQVELPVPEDSGRSLVRPRPRLVGAQVVALDEETDLAVVKVAQTGLAPLPFADSDAVRPGQIVLAFGSPLGLNSSVSLGVVSAIARQLEPDDPMVYLQTDAPINPGNSGGPLVDIDGQIVGINTMILTQSGGSEGIGFAAPSNIVRSVFEQIRKHGRVRRGEIGVHAQTISPLLAAGLQLPRDNGVILSDVYPDGPAAAAGARVGDIVTRLDGKPMENGRQLQVNLYSRAVGDVVRLDLDRNGVPVSIQVPVVEREDDPTRFAALARPQDHLIPRLGILGVTFDRSAAALLPELRVPEGVLVVGTSSDAVPGSDGQIKPGDLIHEINGRRVATLPELREAVDRMKVGDALVLLAEREGEMMYVAVKLEN